MSTLKLKQNPFDSPLCSLQATDEAEKARLKKLADEQASKKKLGNETLMVCSKKYMEIMKALREGA